ncbi:piggyBac transposable element-derived protein 4-like [Hippoglossus stenolepis]|uniref:piggyBac transposable element-derived protein 4-like n=1 Tax=Hippoglossus stenolepis TaxID=195615 RepID=UPI001FAF4D86|nr:piggyBac transposable element-derived protein 4-like [Hippoglossus stenolepis]
MATTGKGWTISCHDAAQSLSHVLQTAALRRPRDETRGGQIGGHARGLAPTRLPRLYNPGPEVTVDEQLVPFRGRCPFRQYMPSKPAKYGIKSWVACDAKSSYAWKMQVYTGKPSGGRPERNQGMWVMLDVTEGLRGRNVTCDNYFTSYELARQLLERKITVVGTVRKNKPELPTGLLAVKGREVFSSRFAFTPTATLVSYIPKKNKNVVLLSMRHAEADVSNREDGKPVIVLDYNRNKGSVDNLDKVIGMYSCRRMTARWPLVVFHNILDVSSYNTFVIWREINPDWMPGKRNKRRVFLEQLGKTRDTVHRTKGAHPPHGSVRRGCEGCESRRCRRRHTESS